MRSNILSKPTFASCVWYSDRAYYWLCVLIKDVGRQLPSQLQCSYRGQQGDVRQFVRGNYKTLFYCIPGIYIKYFYFYNILRSISSPWWQDRLLSLWSRRTPHGNNKNKPKVVNVNQLYRSWIESVDMISVNDLWICDAVYTAWEWGLNWNTRQNYRSVSCKLSYHPIWGLQLKEHTPITGQVAGTWRLLKVDQVLLFMVVRWDGKVRLYR